MSTESLPIGDREPSCSCSGPGYCIRFRREQGPYAYGICSGQGSPGKPCTAEKSESYRKKWRLELVTPRTAVPSTLPRRSSQPVLSGGKRATTESPSIMRVRSQADTADGGEDEGRGPGSELKVMLAELGIDPNAGCNCRSRARQMDEWGVVGCRANKGEIVAWLKGEVNRRGWATNLTEGFVQGLRMVSRGWVNILDPVGSLVDEAIRRAEERGDSGGTELHH